MSENSGPQTGRESRFLCRNVAVDCRNTEKCIRIKALMGTRKFENCTIYNRTIGGFKSQIQYNRQLQWYKLVPLLCMEKHFLAWFSEKNSPKTKFFECWFASKNRFLQKMASNKNVNQTQEKKKFYIWFFPKNPMFCP